MSIFRMGTDVSMPLQVGSNGAVTAPEGVSGLPMEGYDDDEGTIELDVRCCCKGLLLFVCALSFLLGVFACGAAFATQDYSPIPSRFVELQHNSAMQQQQRQQLLLNEVTANSHVAEADTARLNDSATATASATAPSAAPTAATATTASALPTREYIEIRYQTLRGQPGQAIGSLDQCIHLVLQTTAFRVTEVLLEQNSVLLLPEQQAVGQSNDLLIELLARESTIEKVQACARVVLQGDPGFVYR